MDASPATDRENPGRADDGGHIGSGTLSAWSGCCSASPWQYPIHRARLTEQATDNPGDPDCAVACLHPDL